jgi:hypothetical protein
MSKIEIALLSGDLGDSQRQEVVNIDHRRWLLLL